MGFWCCLEDEFLGCGRKICGLITCLLFFGPACIIVAIAMFIVAAKDPRTHDINKYDLAVDAWVNGKYAEFSSLGLAFQVQDNEGVLQLMDNATAPDPIHDSGKNIHKYSDYLRYQYHGDIFDTPSNSDRQTVTVRKVNTGEEMPVGVYAYDTTWYTPSQLGCTHSCSSTTYSSGNCYNSLTCQQYCHNRNGYWDFLWDYCYVIRYAEEICIKVQDDGSFNFQDQLCYSEQYTDWQPDPEGSTGGYRDIPPVLITVRAASDPFIALYKTAGSDLWFGLTAKQYAEMGIIFIVVGGFFCAIISGLFILACFLGNCLCFNGRGSSRF
eukprot:Phypoly_transcript_10279.p1 GENE.Phypoly_transcript_10279~~Phypoly_transcript_10279.p1  ORF type:complete len:325 (+),score=25.52 Phypoly_transcript_10279:251-1225(+)